MAENVRALMGPAWEEMVLRRVLGNGGGMIRSIVVV
jgi:hypothetical protein